MLERGGSSLDAVTAAVRMLEDNPQFNAGRGAVLNRDGMAELDASVMDGRTLGAGAVAGVRHVKNPVELARLVMEKSPHVMLVGEGAEEFALEQGVELVPHEYFRTRARAARAAATEDKRAAEARDDRPRAPAPWARWRSTARQSRRRHLDRRHDEQAPGRVGDSPIIGAGTYANNEQLRGVGHRGWRILHPRGASRTTSARWCSTSTRRSSRR